MRLNRWIPALFVLALVAGPVAANCGSCGSHDDAATEAHAHADGEAHTHAETEAKACCADASAGKLCGADCPHAKEALQLAKAAESGDKAAMEKLVVMVKESGHEDAIMLADKAAGGCEASQATLIAMVKEHVSGQSSTQLASLTKMAEAAGNGCAMSTASLIAEAKKSENPKMVELATKAEGGCEHSKDALIAMVTESSDTDKN